MNEISEHNSYNIDDLVNVWGSGWQHLEKFAKLQSSYELKESGDKSKHYLERLLSVLDEVLSTIHGIGLSFDAPEPCPSYIELLNLAASDSNNPYTPVIKPVYEDPGIYVIGFAISTSKSIARRAYSNRLGSWSKDKRKLKKTIKKLTAAFSKSKNIEEVFLNIADKKNIQLFTEIWAKQDFQTSWLTKQFWAEKDYLNAKINPKISKFMRWLEYGTKSKNAFEEAWWNCLWLYINPTIDLMLDVKKQIDEDIPIYREQINTLDYYLSFGCPTIYLSKDDNGAFKAETILKPKETELNRLGWSPFLKMSIILLVQPAFDLTQKLQCSFSKPKFIVRCHAPSCGKLFYTQRKSQVVCGGSRDGRKTKCALEWQQYRNWLKTLLPTTKPEQIWDKPKRIKEFLSRNH